MSLFDNLSSHELQTLPFPHMIVPNILDRHLCEQLIESRPSLEHIAKGSTIPGQKFHYNSARALEDAHLASIWKDTIREHLSPAVCRKFLTAFAPAIQKQYPELIKRFGNVGDWSIGQRYVDAPEDHVLLADAQFTYHMPIPGEPAQERGPHIKICNKLIICIYLLRLFEDKDPGGDFELYSAVDGAPIVYGKDQQIVNSEAVKLYKTIPYEANTAVFFLNSPRTITTFAKRWSNPHPYMYFNVILEFPKPIFSLLQKFEPALGAAAR